MIGLKIMNADGSINVGSTGYKYAIDTLTEIKNRVITQKFYEVSPAEFMPVDVGQASWMDEIVQPLSFQTGGDFFQGDVDTLEGNGQIASVGAILGNVRMPINTWAKGINYTVMEIEKALAAQNWNVVESKLESLKKNWDLGIQQVAFLGHPSITGMTGLINASEVNINTALITEPLSEMDATEFTLFVKGVLTAYFTNSNDTAMPDTFVIPTSDYLGMGVPYSSAYPNISKLEYLENNFKKMTGNAGFQILPLAYAQATRNEKFGVNKNRYTLYKNSPDVLTMNIPVDFTMLQPGTSNNIMFQQPAYGQYSGVLISRKREVLYFDETAPST